MNFGHLGPTKNIINGVAYVLVIISSFLMHFFSKWMKYKLKSEAADEKSSGVMKKTGKVKIVDCAFIKCEIIFIICKF